MQFERVIGTIESHTAGEALRIVTSGVPVIPGATILEKRRWVAENLDQVRRALMHEPRGHADMYGCYVTPPVTDQADLGVIFMHNEGYSTMCGHGVIALAMVAVANRWVEPVEPETRVGLDTPAGFVDAFVEWDSRSLKAGRTRFRNVPSFLYRRDLEVTTPTFGKLRVDIAFGGAFYAYLDGAHAGLDVRPENYRPLIQLGDEVKRAVEAVVEVVHPLEPELRGIYGTIIDGSPRLPGSHQANVCVFADREVDRSPTGTGTAGRVAQLHAQGRLALGDTLVNESIIGTTFTGRALEETTVGEYAAVIPEISGQAYITGLGQWLIDPDDPTAQGFFLR
ncbi:MAG: trans-3-hydroxy-L-proline dehydratase [Chloroflexia bacterium]